MELKEKLTRHIINGDKKTNLFEDIIYVLFFLLEILNDKKNIQNYNHFKNFESFLELNITDDYFNISPSRILCQFFLLNWLRNNFSPDKDVNILDVGCGNGVALTIFEKYFKNVKYFGCDSNPRESWKKLENKNINFFEQKLENEIQKELPKIDLIHSQSVFEHIKYDQSAFKQLVKKFQNSKQIHFLPAPISFLNYEKHGYRRYSLNSLKKLEKILKKNIQIYNLGSLNALRYHFNWLDKKKHNFKLQKILKFKENFSDERELLKFLFTDSSKSYPVYYAVQF
tara:strand:- start:390 stop:1241 length:852 start_codon:yes stop_codon:yes gene_type:complete